MGSVRQGAVPQPLEGWMEELYRRMSDRQTMGSVVQELRTTLSDAEKLIDQFFRNPTDPTVLIPVPNHLSAMRGVLSVLGMDHAASALLRMRDEVDGLSSTEVDLSRVGQAGVFDRLAGNLGALGFLIDMLSVQPALAKSLFIYDPEAGTLSPVMGRSDRAPVTPGEPSPVAAEPRLIEQAQMLAFNAAREDVSIDAVARDLERLSQEATAADQPALSVIVACHNYEAFVGRALASVTGQRHPRVELIVVDDGDFPGRDDGGVPGVVRTFRRELQLVVHGHGALPTEGTPRMPRARGDGMRSLRNPVAPRPAPGQVRTAPTLSLLRRRERRA
jgi:hypothetical protein